MSRIILSLLSTVFLVPLVLASAAAQFKLDVTWDVSNCFIQCHQKAVGSVPIDGTGGHNAVQWITRNCENQAWQNLMSHCLPLTCNSAPDVAYALEYGQTFCARAGVRGITLQLSEEYMNGSNGSYFQSEEYLKSSATAAWSYRTPSMAVAGFSVLLALALLS